MRRNQIWSYQRNGRVHLNRPAWTSVQSTAGSRGVRISGSNAGYTAFWGTAQGCWLPTPIACFPFTSPTMRHRVPSGFNRALLYYNFVLCFAPQRCNWFTCVATTCLLVLLLWLSSLCWRSSLIDLLNLFPCVLASGLETNSVEACTALTLLA